MGDNSCCFADMVVVDAGRCADSASAACSVRQMATISRIVTLRIKRKKAEVKPPSPLVVCGWIEMPARFAPSGYLLQFSNLAGSLPHHRVGSLMVFEMIDNVSKRSSRVAESVRWGGWTNARDKRDRLIQQQLVRLSSPTFFLRGRASAYRVIWNSVIATVHMKIVFRLRLRRRPSCARWPECVRRAFMVKGRLERALLQDAIACILHSSCFYPARTQYLKPWADQIAHINT